MTNEEKIEWLRGYRTACLEAQRTREEMERWRSIAEKVTPSLSAVRYTAAETNRMARIIEKIDEHRADLTRALEAMVDRCAAIERAIDTVPDARLRLLLRLRYIDGLTFSEAARHMNVSTRWALKMHGRAVDSLDFTL